MPVKKKVLVKPLHTPRTYRLPRELVEQMEDYCELRGMKKETFVSFAIAAYLKRQRGE